MKKPRGDSASEAALQAARRAVDARRSATGCFLERVNHHAVEAVLVGTEHTLVALAVHLLLQATGTTSEETEIEIQARFSHASLVIVTEVCVASNLPELEALASRTRYPLSPPVASPEKLRAIWANEWEHVAEPPPFSDTEWGSLLQGVDAGLEDDAPAPGIDSDGGCLDESRLAGTRESFVLLAAWIVHEVLRQNSRAAPAARVAPRASMPADLSIGRVVLRDSVTSVIDYVCDVRAAHAEHRQQRAIRFVFGFCQGVRPLLDVAEAFVDEWSPEPLPLVLAMATLGGALIEAGPQLNEHELTRLCDGAEQIATGPHRDEDDAVCTGFLEAIVGAEDRAPGCAERILVRLGPECRRYVDAWDRFHGITPRRWPQRSIRPDAGTEVQEPTEKGTNMSIENPAQSQSPIVIERAYRSSIEDIWSLWTTKEGFESWWGPQGFRVEVHALEAREGGALHYDMIADSPEMVAAMQEAGQPVSHPTRSRFTAVKPHQHIEVTSVIDFLPGVEPYESTFSVDFTDPGDTVRMVVTLNPMHSTEVSNMQKEGFESQLGKLDSRFA